LFNNSSSLLISGFIILLLCKSSLFIEGVESLHDDVVLKRVSLGLVMSHFVLSHYSQL
jgi:hypothetical protein